MYTFLDVVSCLFFLVVVVDVVAAAECRNK